MAQRRVGDHSLERNNLVALWAILWPLASLLAVRDCGRSMTTQSDRARGF